MLKFEKFTGINNVLPSHRLKNTELTEAENVDIGLSGEISRRGGRTVAHVASHKNLHQAEGFMLATVADDLYAIAPNGARTLIYDTLSDSPRVWYTNLPDGRTTFSNGLINGITDGATRTTWGVPIPASIGAMADIAGGLFPGDYQYGITYVRTSDSLEGPPAYSNPDPIADGGVFLSGLPVLAGHTINVYLTGHNGEELMYAGNTANGVFTFTGTNEMLVMPCRTNFLDVAPVGTISSFWRGRALVAKGNVLYASLQSQWELFNLRRDFKQFSGDITAVVPVDGGIYVGTTEEFAFLAGVEFDKLQYKQVVSGAVVLGSGVSVRGELIKRGEGGGLGTAAVVIADGIIVAGFSDGGVMRLTEGVYRTTATEVSATFRTLDGIPQYIAVPQ